jgi:hypothetical protein
MVSPIPQLICVDCVGQKDMLVSRRGQGREPSGNTMHAAKEASSMMYFPFFLSLSLSSEKGVDACGMGCEPP